MGNNLTRTERGKQLVVYNRDVSAMDCEPGIRRKILAYSDELMMCEITFEKGAQGYMHSHPHQQATYIVKGSFEFTIDNVKTVVKEGDSLFMPSNSIHGTVALEDSVLVDVFTPKREDFIE